MTWRNIISDKILNVTAAKQQQLWNYVAWNGNTRWHWHSVRPRRFWHGAAPRPRFVVPCCPSQRHVAALFFFFFLFPRTKVPFFPQAAPCPFSILGRTLWQCPMIALHWWYTVKARLDSQTNCAARHKETQSPGKSSIHNWDTVWLKHWLIAPEV